MKKTIIKYLPDIIIITGVYILSYNIFRPETSPLNFDLTNYHTEGKVQGILLIVIGLDIVIRRYFKIKINHEYKSKTI